MAFSFNVSASLLSLLLVTSLSISLTSASELLDDVCKKAINPSLCLKSLKADGRVAGSRDLKTLGYAGIDMAQEMVRKAQKITASSNSGVSNACQETYGDAIASLEDAKKALKSGDYGSLNQYVSAAMTNVDTCDEGFTEMEVPETPALRDASARIKAACSAILVVSNRL